MIQQITDLSHGPYACLARHLFGGNFENERWLFECTRCKFFELHSTESSCKWRESFHACANRDAQTESLLHLIQQAQRELARRWMGTAYVMRVPDSKDAPAILLESSWW